LPLGCNHHRSLLTLKNLENGYGDPLAENIVSPRPFGVKEKNHL